MQILIIVAIMLIGYSLPWISDGTSTLSVHAYDLAEWLSLNPVERNAQPALLTSGVLRAQLILILAYIGYAIFNTYKRSRITFLIWFVMVVIFAVALLPPLEFLQNFDDINYQQQLLLTMGSLAIGVILPFLNTNVRDYLIIGLGLLGIVSSIWAIPIAIERMGAYGIDVRIGLGVVIFVIGHLAIIGFVLVRKTKRATD